MKHLIYLIDGTWLFAGRIGIDSTPTNISAINSYLHYYNSQRHRQIVHYVRGLGSVEPRFRRYTSGGFAFGVEETIQDIYLNICCNYEAGDGIHVFGFSRGAVIARAVCSMLNYGVLRNESLGAMEDVWEAFLYDSRPRIFDEPNASEAGKQVARLRALQSSLQEESPQVTFLGIFDTVIGGAGLTRRIQRLNYLSPKVPRCVQHTVQILALDEQRKSFLPQLYDGLDEECLDGATLEQIWMPGVHGDIGGGYKDSELALFSQLVMIDRAIARAKLKFDLTRPLSRILDPAHIVPINDEFKDPIWKMLGTVERAVVSSNATIHPVADDLSRKTVDYKGERTSQYSVPTNDQVERCEYFVSEELSGHRFFRQID